MAVLPAQPEATSAMRAAPHPLPEIGAKRRVAPGRVLAVAAAGAGLAFVDATIVNVAFPDMQADFAGTSLGALSWILNAYNIVFAAFLVAAGRLADLAGRRRTFHAGIVLFTVASAACAAAPSVELLVAARVLQALGAAITVPASLALVLEAYPPAERAHGVALWTAAAALAAGLGPSLGGALVELGGWRLAFLVNVPLGIVALAAGRRVLVESRAPGRRTLPDLRGAGLAALAIGMLTLGIVQGEEWGWTSPGVLAAFAAALGCGVVFVRRCRWHRAPMLDLDLLRIRPLSVANVLSVVAAAGFYAYVLNNVLFLTGAWGYSVLDAGLALSVGPFVAAAVARPASRLAGRLGYRPMLLLGGLVWAAGLVYMQTRVGLRPAFVREWLPGMLLLGVGAGLTFPLLSSAAVASAPGERFATATSLSSVSRQVGAVLGVSLLIVVVGTPDPAEVAAAFDRGWTFSAVCMLVVAVGALALGRIAPAATADAPSASFVGPVPPAAAPARKAPEWPSPTAPLRPGNPATIAVAGLQSGLPLDVVCHALERKLGRAVLRLDSEQLWSDDGRRQLERAGRVLAVTAGGPVPFRLQGRPDLHGSDVLLVDGPTGTRGFGLWLDVLQARARHVAVGAGFDAAIGRVARRMSGHSVGLVLSGGGARALAHIGVVEELLAAGIEIDRVGGTSMGAFLGALLAMGHDPEEIEACCYEQWVRRSPLTDYRLPRVSLLRGARARAMIDRTFPGNIEALPLDFFCVTCDLVAGDMVVHRRGSLAKAVGASISIPGLVPPMARHGRLLVDGGVLNNLPVDVMATAHEGPIIAVDVTSRVAPPADDDAEPSLHETLVRTLTLGSIDTTAAARRHADLVIRPVDQGAGILEFHQLDRLRAEGRRAARAALRDAPERLFVSTEAAARRAGHAG
jgi:EmrB/QacA subfamily drug resistance transporter